MPRFQIQAHLQPWQPFFLLAGQGESSHKTQLGAPSCRATSAWCSPRWRYRVQVRYSGYTRLTTQPILRIRIPVFYLKTYFFHIFYQQRLSKTKKNNIKKTKCYEKTPKLKFLPYLRIFFKIFTGINLTLFYNQPDHLDLQLKKVALFCCLVRGPSKAACK